MSAMHEDKKGVFQRDAPLSLPYERMLRNNVIFCLYALSYLRSEVGDLGRRLKAHKHSPSCWIVIKLQNNEKKNLIYLMVNVLKGF